MALTDPPFFCHGCQAATAIHGTSISHLSHFCASMETLGDVFGEDLHVNWSSQG
jgi:hypothetical protein